MDIAMGKTRPQLGARKNQLQDEVAARVRALRKAQGLTLKEIAGRLGTTTQTAQRLETGALTLTLYWIERFAEAFDVPVYELLSDGALRDSIAARLRAEKQLNALRGGLESLCDIIRVTHLEELGS